MSPDTSKEPQPPQPAEAPAQTDAAQKAEDRLPKNKVTVQDAGTLKKKITIEVPRDRVNAKFNEMFGELGRTALVPGFRIGHAPRRLIEKRFGKDVSQDVRNVLVGEALESALKESKIEPLGEPDLKLEEIKVPDQGDFTFSFEIEVAPEFELPDYKAVEVRRPIMELTEEQVDHAINGARRNMGTFRPVEGPAREGDAVVADVVVAGEGVQVSRPNAELRVAPAEVEGIPLEDLPKALVGRQAGQTCQLKTQVPAAHPNEAWRGKDVTVSLAVREVKRLELPALDDEFAKRTGFESAAVLRQSVRTRLEAEVKVRQRHAMEDEVAVYLLQNAKFDLPEGLVLRQAHKLLSRRVVEMMDRGVPRAQIEQHAEQISKDAGVQAVGQLKLSFILTKIADNEGVTVEDAEVNSRIAQMARHYGRRPERLRQELKDNGTLDELYSAVREEKVMAKILETAKVTDVRPEDVKPAPAEEKAEKAAKPEQPPAEAAKETPAQKHEEAAKAEKAPKTAAEEAPPKKPRKPAAKAAKAAKEPRAEKADKGKKPSAKAQAKHPARKPEASKKPKTDKPGGKAK